MSLFTLNPTGWVQISSGSCTIEKSDSLELVYFKEGDKVVTESYLNSNLIILSNEGISAQCANGTLDINVEDF